MAPIIQLGFDPQDDRLWWCDEFRWETQDETPDTVHRPTEIFALRGIYRQARLIRRKGILINLSPLHLHIMCMEQLALISEPLPDNIYNWISSRVHGIPPLQVKAILDECSFVVLLREVLHMPTIEVEWPVRKDVTKRVA